MKTATTTSSICPKCHGAGKLDWTDQDGGVCYKCEGVGYLGEMPEGFNKNNKESRKEAEAMVKSSLSKKGLNVSGYEFHPDIIKDLATKNICLKYNYNKFWMNMPDMTLDFGGNNEYKWRLIVGGEFLIIKPVKIG